MADFLTLQIVSGGHAPEVQLVTPSSTSTLVLTDAVTGAGDQMGDGVLTANFLRAENLSLSVDGQSWPLEAQDWVISLVRKGEHWERTTLAGDPASQLPSHSDLAPSVGWVCYLVLSALVIGAMSRRRAP